MHCLLSQVRRICLYSKTPSDVCCAREKGKEREEGSAGICFSFEKDGSSSVANEGVLRGVVGKPNRKLFTNSVRWSLEGDIVKKFRR